jgi:hypothetical protein
VHAWRRKERATNKKPNVNKKAPTGMPSCQGHSSALPQIWWIGAAEQSYREVVQSSTSIMS